MYDEVEHYGVKGMRWGVRRSGKSGSVGTKKNIRKEANQAKKNRKEKMKRRRSLSLEDLKKEIYRLELEKRLKDLSSSDISPGKTAVKEILSRSGKQALTQSLTKLLSEASTYAIASAIGGKNIDKNALAARIMKGEDKKKDKK